MNGAGYIEVLEKGLVPYLKNIESNPRFMQDNDPKCRVGVALGDAYLKL